MTEDEMLRLACIYAERDRQEFLDAYSHCDDAGAKSIKRETRAFLKKLHAYRLKRWGKTKLETMMAAAKLVPAPPYRGRPTP